MAAVIGAVDKMKEIENLTKRKIFAAIRFILGDPNPTTKDRERIKDDPNIKSQMQKAMGWRYPGQRQVNSYTALVVGILGFVIFILLMGIFIWIRYK